MLLSRDDTELFVAAWFVAHLPLVYLPVDFQIHLLLGWQVPIAIFAARAIATRLAPAVASRTWLTWQSAVVLLVIVTFATNAYLLAWRFVELGRHDAPYFMSDNDVAALDWLDGHATRNDVVFSDPEIGQFVPMSSDARAFVGHWANTLDYGDKRNLVASVFSADATPDAREAAFAKYGVTLVVARPGNGQGSGLFSASDPGAQLVFQQGDVAIYRVTDGR
jgi:hypothetical protein